MYFSFCSGQSSRTESSNQLDGTEESFNVTIKQVSYPQSLLQATKNISTQEYSENKAGSSSEESSSISSSDEEDQMDLKASADHCHEPIFVKVNYYKTAPREYLCKNFHNFYFLIIVI